MGFSLTKTIQAKFVLSDPHALLDNVKTMTWGMTRGGKKKRLFKGKLNLPTASTCLYNHTHPKMIALSCHGHLMSFESNRGLSRLTPVCQLLHPGSCMLGRRLSSSWAWPHLLQALHSLFLDRIARWPPTVTKLSIGKREPLDVSVNAKRLQKPQQCAACLVWGCKPSPWRTKHNHPALRGFGCETLRLWKLKDSPRVFMPIHH